jgi:hypothetical protein
MSAGDPAAKAPNNARPPANRAKPRERKGSAKAMPPSVSFARAAEAAAMRGDSQARRPGNRSWARLRIERRPWSGILQTPGSEEKILKHHKFSLTIGFSSFI